MEWTYANPIRDIIMGWTYVDDAYPPTNEYVLVSIDGYVGIAKLVDDEWEWGLSRHLPLYKGKDKIKSKLAPLYWKTIQYPDEKDNDPCKPS